MEVDEDESVVSFETAEEAPRFAVHGDANETSTFEDESVVSFETAEEEALTAEEISLHTGGDGELMITCKSGRSSYQYHIVKTNANFVEKICSNHYNYYSLCETMPSIQHLRPIAYLTYEKTLPPYHLFKHHSIVSGCSFPGIAVHGGQREDSIINDSKTAILNFDRLKEEMRYTHILEDDKSLFCDNAIDLALCKYKCKRDVFISPVHKRARVVAMATPGIRKYVQERHTRFDIDKDWSDDGAAYSEKYLYKRMLPNLKFFLKGECGGDSNKVGQLLGLACTSMKVDDNKEFRRQITDLRIVDGLKETLGQLQSQGKRKETKDLEIALASGLMMATKNDPCAQSNVAAIFGMNWRLAKNAKEMAAKSVLNDESIL